MRFVAILISVLASVSAATAETLQERVVALFKEVCVVPNTPEAMMMVGEKSAAAGGWKLIRSGPAPMPMQHNENGPPVSIESAWELDLPQAANVKLWMSMIGPEFPGVRHTVCMIAAPVAEFIDEEFAREVEQQFGSALTREKPRGKAAKPAWFFTQDKDAGNCGKQIGLSRHRHASGNFTTLLFADMAYPNDGNWAGALAETRCRS